MYSDSGPHI